MTNTHWQNEGPVFENLAGHCCISADGIGKSQLGIRVLYTTIVRTYIVRHHYVYIALQGLAPPLLPPDSTLLRCWTADNKTVAMYQTSTSVAYVTAKAYCESVGWRLGILNSPHTVLCYIWCHSSRRWLTKTETVWAHGLEWNTSLIMSTSGCGTSLEKKSASLLAGVRPILIQRRLVLTVA